MITLRESVPTEALLKAWGDPEPKDKDGVSYFQRGDRAYYLPDADPPGTVIVAGPAELIADEVIPAAGVPPALGRDMEALLAASDADRDLTVLASPSVLYTGGRAWLAGDTLRVRASLDWFLSGNEPDVPAAADGAIPAAPPVEGRTIDLSSHGMPQAVLCTRPSDRDRLIRGAAHR